MNGNNKYLFFLFILISHTAKSQSSFEIEELDKGKQLNKEQKYSESVLLFTKVINSNSDNKDALFGRAYAYFKLLKFDLAIKDFSFLIKIDPSNSKAYEARGLSYKFLKNYEKAISDLNESITLDPQNVVAIGRISDIYYQQKEYRLAISSISRLIAINQKNSNAFDLRGECWLHLNEGKAYKSNDDYDSAYFNFSIAIQLESKNASAYLNRALTSKYLSARKLYTLNILFPTTPSDDFAKAIALNGAGAYDTVINRAMRLYKDVFLSQSIKASVNSENFNEYLRVNANEAVDLLSILINNGPADELNLLRRARIYTSIKEQHNAAIRDCNAALKLNPNNSLTYLILGQAYVGINDFLIAETCYSNAIKYSPNEAGYYSSRSSFYSKYNKNESAIIDIKTAIKLDSTNKDYKITLQGLEFKLRNNM